MSKAHESMVKMVTPVEVRYGNRRYDAGDVVEVQASAVDSLREIGWELVEFDVVKESEELPEDEE